MILWYNTSETGSGREEKSIIRAVLFDMDGLLVDSERVAMLMDVEAGKRTGYPITWEIALRTLGVTRQRSIEIYTEAFGRFSPEKFYPVFDALTEEAALKGEMHAKKGAEELLKYLTDRGIPYAVATSSPLDHARLRLSSAGLWQYFSVFATGREVKRSKPAPDIFLLAAEKLGAKPEGCLVLEDSPNGVKAGRAGGMQVCMVPDLAPYGAELAPYCDHVCEDLSQVIDLMEKEKGEDQ